jgi:hypothetical protein
LSIDDKPEKFRDYLNELDQGQLRADEAFSSDFEVLRMKALLKQDQLGSVKDLLDQCLGNNEYCEESDFCVEASKILRTKFAKDEIAVDLLRASLENEFHGEVFTHLMTALCQIGSFELATSYSDKWLHKLTLEWKSKVRQELFEAQGDYDGALRELALREQDTGVPADTHRIYLLLKMKRYEEAEKIARTLLVPINFSPEAAEIIVNFEIARKNIGKNVDLRRLEAVLRLPHDQEVKAAVSALLGKKLDAIAATKKAMADDNTFRFRARAWPAFDDFRANEEFTAALSIETSGGFNFVRAPAAA